MTPTPETKAQIERMRALFTCAHEGKSWLPRITQQTVAFLTKASLVEWTDRGYRLTARGLELVLCALSEAP